MDRTKHSRSPWSAVVIGGLPVALLIFAGCAGATTDAAVSSPPETTPPAPTVPVPAQTPAAVTDVPAAIEAAATDSLTAAEGEVSSEFEFEVGSGSAGATDANGNALPQGVKWVCKASINAPHWSTGGLTVLSKVRISCTGPTATLPIVVQGVLGRTTQNSISSLKIVYNRGEVRNVTANGGQTTWYVPVKNQGYNFGKGYYYRSSYAAASAPPLIPFSVGTGASNFVYVG